MPANDKLAALHDRLSAQVEALVDSQDWRAFLAVAARFHRYSTGVSGISELCECSRRHQAEGWEALVR